MRAVNLVPADSRPGRVNGGKSGGAVFGVFGVLAFLLLALSMIAMSHRDKAKAEQQLATIKQSTESYTNVASQYASFEAAASQASGRINTVRSLSEARFDWAGALRDMSRLIPADTQVLTLAASVASDGAGAGGGGSSFRSALPGPAISLTGCTKSQNSAANLVTQLQAMRRVINVTLGNSTRGSSTGATGGCTLGGKSYDISIVVFFAPGRSQASGSITPSTANAATTAISSESATPAGTTPAATTPAADSGTTSTPASGASQ